MLAVCVYRGTRCDTTTAARHLHHRGTADTQADVCHGCSLYCYSSHACLLSSVSLCNTTLHSTAMGHGTRRSISGWRPHPGLIVIAEGANESLGCSNGKQASICIVLYHLNFLKKIKIVILRRQECVNIDIFIVPNSTLCIVTAVVHGMGYPSQGGTVCCDL